MPTVDRSRIAWYASFWCRAALMSSLLLSACSRDVTPPQRRRPGPPAEPNLERQGNWGQRGRLLSATLVGTIDRATVPNTIRTAVASTIPRFSASSIAALQAAAVDAFDARYDVQQWSITYTTVGVHGELVTVSGALYLPVAGSDPVPLLSLSHGTVTNKPGVPSSPVPIPHALAHAAHGAAVVLADYIGMGVDAADSPAYLLADVSATTSLDALRAARQFAKEHGLSLDGRLFVAGYSQGGQVAMALARLIESDPRSGFRVTAAAPMSGPYDLYATADTVLIRTTAYVPSSVYVVYAVAAYWKAYGLTASLDELLIPSAADVGERLLTLGMTQAEAASAVPPIASNALQPDVLDAVLHDPEAPLSVLLRQNQTFDWLPDAPLRMYYGTADMDVPPFNAVTTAEHMYLLGATADQVLAVKLTGPAGEALNHMSAQWFAYTRACQWFDTFPRPADPADPERRSVTEISRLPRYSAPNVIVGSTRDARSAGSVVAANDTSTSTSATTP